MYFSTTLWDLTLLVRPNLRLKNKARCSLKTRSSAMSCTSPATNSSVMVLENSSTEMKMAQYQLLLTQLLEKNTKAATRKVKPGMENSAPFQLATKNAELIHADISYANSQKSTLFLGLKRKTLHLSFGSTSWTRCAKAYVVSISSTLRIKSGAKLTLRVLLFLPCIFTRTRRATYSASNSVARTKMTSGSIWTKSCSWPKVKNWSSSSSWSCRLTNPLDALTAPKSSTTSTVPSMRYSWKYAPS